MRNAFGLLLWICAATCGVTSLAAAASDSRLVEAARTGDHAAVRRLLAGKVSVNARAADGSTALLWAVHRNEVAMAQLLVKSGADGNLANDFQTTPLAEACLNANADMVHLLLTAGAKAEVAIATGETPLMTCSRTGSVEGVRALLAAGAAANAKEVSQNQTALMWAIAEKHVEVVQVLLGAHADVNAATKQGFRPMHFAARVGDVAIIEELRKAGVDVNVRTAGTERDASFGYTPLFVATLRGQIDAAIYLVDHGADPNIMDAGMMPLHWAATSWEGYASNPVYGFADAMSGIQDRADKLRLVKALLAHGADVNTRMRKRQPSFATGYTDSVGATAFLLAASVDDVEMMRILLAAGADPKIATATNATTIMAATGLNHGIGESLVTEDEAMAAVQLLLDLGLDPKGETTFGENALFGPAYRGWNRLLAQMIDRGVNVNAVSKAGVTAWRAAMGQGDRLGGVLVNLEGAALLEKHGADPTLGTVCEAQNRCREK
jgi:uncharacterized protein